MTLVVAKATKHQVIILSDTRKGDPRQDRQIGGVTDGLLKTTFLSENIAVAFTGDPDLAQETVRGIRGNGLNFRDVLDFFATATAHNENEYIVGFAGPRRLFEVRNGSIHERKAAWIGDKSAFERFQSGPQSAPQNNFRRATIIGPDVSEQNFVLDQIDRLQTVVEDSTLQTVGDFFTVAVSNGGRFRFISIATLYFDAESRILGPTGNPILSASGENRAFRFTAWFPRKQTVAATAFVFPEVKKAFVFHSKEKGFADECAVFDGLSGDSLADEIEKKTGIRFEVLEIRHA